VDESLIQIIIIVFLLLLSGFFSSAETGFNLCNRVRMKALADEGNKSAKRVLEILENYPKMLSAILIGNNIVNLTASALTTIITSKLGVGYLISIGTGIITFLVLIFGEIVPKTIAAAMADSLALAYSRVITMLMVVMTPFIAVVNAFSNIFLKLFRVDTNTKYAMTESELRAYVNVSHEEGVIESEEKDMINNVFDFSDSVAKDIMIPRIDMTCVPIDATYDDVIKVFKKDMYTRIPVYEESQDNVVGLINIKDFVLIKDKAGFKISSVLRPAFFTYEYKKTDDLMMEMRAQMQNVAFVMSEYGDTVGMITLEDLLEEIVGEIRDEYDSDEEELIQNIGDGNYLIEGGMKIDDINDALGTDMDSEDYDSIGGLIIEKLEKIPVEGDEIVLDNGIELKVHSIIHNRIVKVVMTINNENDEENTSETEE